MLSVLLIWWPAYRLSSQLLLVSDMTHIQEGKPESIGQIAAKLKDLVEKDLPRFQASDVRLLGSGFILAVASSILKLCLILSSH